MGAGLPARRRRAGRASATPAGSCRCRRAAASRSRSTGCRASTPAVRAACSGWRCRPNYATRPATCTPTSPPPTDNRIVRFRLAGGRTRGRSSTASPRPASTTAAGSRSGPDGMLYAGTGDAGDRAASQDPTSLERQDPAADPGRRAGAGQPDRRLAGLQPRPPQRAGPRLGRRRAGCSPPSSARTPSTRST